MTAIGDFPYLNAEWAEDGRFLVSVSNIKGESKKIPAYLGTCNTDMLGKYFINVVVRDGAEFSAVPISIDKLEEEEVIEREKITASKNPTELLYNQKQIAELTGSIATEPDSKKHLMAFAVNQLKGLRNFNLASRQMKRASLNRECILAFIEAGKTGSRYLKKLPGRRTAMIVDDKGLVFFARNVLDRGEFTKYNEALPLLKMNGKWLIAKSKGKGAGLFQKNFNLINTLAKGGICNVPKFRNKETIETVSNNGLPKKAAIVKRYRCANEVIGNDKVSGTGLVNFFIDIVETLLKFSWVHGDLKPENFLYEGDLENEFKGILNDFGLAKVEGTTDYGGTPDFLPPEVVFGLHCGFLPPIKKGFDAWAFAVSLVVMASSPKNYYIQGHDPKRNGVFPLYSEFLKNDREIQDDLGEKKMAIFFHRAFSQKDRYLRMSLIEIAASVLRKDRKDRKDLGYILESLYQLKENAEKLTDEEFKFRNIDMIKSIPPSKKKTNYGQQKSVSI